MANRYPGGILLAVWVWAVLFTASASISFAHAGGGGELHQQLGWMIGGGGGGGCQGTIGECLAAEGDEEEFQLESEASRRILATRRRYISYLALKRNTVPCNRRGASYYGCGLGRPVNSYRRGCSAITRCRR